MIVTRELINKTITFRDCPYLDNPYTFADLSKDIDAYKNLLQHTYHAVTGQSVLIGEQSGRTQLALVFACLELGLTITIVDYGRTDNFQTDYFDPKTTLLLPIHFFIVSTTGTTNKFAFFNSACETTIVLADVTLDYTPNQTLNATPSTMLLKCTSSGTTGTPKIVHHTHEFIFALAMRNATMFDGVIGQAFNLSHGSSLATFFLPTLFSEKVTNYINFYLPDTEEILARYSIDHLMLPYPDMIEVFIGQYKKSIYSGINLYSLTYIRSEWKEHTQDGKIKDIISFFGSNETSGPTLINRVSYDDFNRQRYHRVDDFYGLEISNTELIVTLPIYNTKIETKDEFLAKGNTFLHLGRNDMHRINGRFFMESSYQRVVKDKFNSDLVFDSVHNRIYLAVWETDDNLDMKISEIQEELKKRSENDHYISKYKVLSYEDFLSGIKLDQELLREYFRRYV
jgi:AMP-binding enzyme